MTKQYRKISLGFSKETFREGHHIIYIYIEKDIFLKEYNERNAHNNTNLQ